MKKEYITPVSRVKKLDTDSLLDLGSAQNEQGNTGVGQLTKEDWFSEDEEDENDGATPVYTYNAWGE